MTEGWALLALASLAAFCVGLSKGGLPSIGSLAVPILALAISPVAAAALLLPVYLATDAVGLWLYRHSFSRRNLAILVPAGLIGVLVGWAIASRVDDAVVGALIGAVGIGYCLSVWLRRGPPAAPRPADLPRGMFWGLLTGIASFVSHSGGPTFQMYVLPQRLEKLAFAGTSTILFAILNAAKIVPYWELQSMGSVDPMLAMLALPAGIVGAVLGAWLTRIIPDGLFFRLVQVALFAVSLKLVADGLSLVL